MIIRADLHVHTSASLDGISTLAQQAAAAKAQGMQAIAVTDHDRCTPLPGESLGGVLLIPGCEISTQAGHILGLFLQSSVDFDRLKQSGLPSPQAAVEEIHRCGGVAVLAHPFQSPGAVEGRYGFQVDIIEAANARATFKVRDANEKACALAEARGLPMVGGSDAHARQEVANAYTEIDAAGPTLADMRRALLQGACRPVLNRETPPLRKGLSQLQKTRRAPSPKRLLLALPYLGYCAVKGLARR